MFNQHYFNVTLFWLQEFKVPQKPFTRMTYTDAITFLKESNITKEDGSFYEFGDVSNIWAGTCDFKQCGVLTSVDSDKPVQPHFKLRNSKWYLISSLTVI